MNPTYDKYMVLIHDQKCQLFGSIIIYVILCIIIFFFQDSVPNTYIPGLLFGTFFICPYIGNNHPNWLIFFRGVENINQIQTYTFKSHMFVQAPLCSPFSFGHCAVFASPKGSPVEFFEANPTVFADRQESPSSVDAGKMPRSREVTRAGSAFGIFPGFPSGVIEHGNWKSTWKNSMGNEFSMDDLHYVQWIFFIWQSKCSMVFNGKLNHERWMFHCQDGQSFQAGELL